MIKKKKLKNVISLNKQAENINMNRIEKYSDLPEYGKYVLVLGTDKNMYDIINYHVCEMNDLEDGVDFAKSGKFYWLTESGRKIEDVTHWAELPKI